jgi:hypothetical protein
MRAGVHVEVSRDLLLAENDKSKCLVPTRYASEGTRRVVVFYGPYSAQLSRAARRSRDCRGGNPKMGISTNFW